ncbi:MAG: hypothetical protein RBU37_25370 [Myxococcota bacterium]|jgi:hypothetical protein|nr:hypothetical protein [Myxococcota bacterium]
MFIVRLLRPSRQRPDALRAFGRASPSLHGSSRAQVVAAWVASTLTVSALLLSCGSAEQADTQQREQSIIFGTLRDIDSIRSRYQRARSEPTVQQQYPIMALALHARAAGIAVVEKTVFNAYEPLPSSAPYGLCLPEYAWGSATITSDNRLLTAHHVLHPNSSTSCEFPVLFESIAEGDFPPYRSAEYNQWYSWDTAAPFESEVESEESPFLANRLVQLGLLTWATDENWDPPQSCNANDVMMRGRHRRNHLRRWRTHAVTSGSSCTNQRCPCSPFLNYVSTLGDQQQFEGRDLLVLEATAPLGNPWPPLAEACSSQEFCLQSNQVCHTPSGSFVLDRPALFFDRVKLADFEALSNERPDLLAAEDLPMWLIHSTEWPDNSSPVATLISNPGYYSSTVPMGNGVPVAQDPAVFSLCPEGQAPPSSQSFLYHPGFATSLDARSGSSGGLAMLRGWTEFGLPGITFRGVAVMSRVSQSVGDPAIWDLSNFVPSEDADASNWSYVIATNQAVVDQATEEPPSPPPLPENPDWWAYDWAVSGQLPPAAEEPAISTVTIPEDDATPFWSEPEPSVAAPSVSSTLYLCARPWESSAADQPGLAVGLMGTGTSLGAGNTIGAFMVVCAPWRHASYTSSWNQLYRLGRLLPNDLMVSAFKVPLGRLSDALVSMYEKRENDTLHPISMQLCPPNYALSGLGMIRQPYIGAPRGVYEVGGISYVLCRNIFDLSQTLTVPLNLSSNVLSFPPWDLGAYPHRAFNDFKLSGQSFSVEQRIGRSVAEGGSFVAEQSCTAGQVVVGIHFSTNAEGRILTLNLACRRGP